MNSIKNKTVSFLKWAETHTKTDMLYLAKGSFWGGVSQFGLTIMTLALASSFSRLVTKDVYGQYKYVLSIVSILSTFTLSGLGTAVIQSVSRGYDGSLRYAFWKNMKWCAPFVIGAAIVSAYYYINGNTTIGFAMLIIGSTWPIWNSTNLYGSFLTAKKDFRRNTIYYDLIGNAFPYFCLIVTMLLSGKLLPLIIVYFLSNTLIGIFLYWNIIKIYKPNENVDPDMLSYSKHLSIMGVFGGIVDNLDQILIFHYIGAAELAVYNFATAIPDQIKSPMKNLANLMFPKFAERTDEEIRAGMKNKFFLLLATSMLIIVSYILVAPYIFKIFFPKYMDSVLLSQIFSISLLFIAAIPANTYLSAKKKVKELYIINIVLSLTQVLLSFVSIRILGIIGLLLVRVFMRIFGAVIGIIMYEISVRKNIKTV